MFKTTDGGTHWSKLKPGINPSEGSPRIEYLLVDPLTPTTLYGASSSAGVFKSTDGGANWSEINNGLTTLYTTDLVMDPQTSTTLYVSATGDLFKTTDGGATWVLLTEFDSYNMVIDPKNPNTFYANSWVGNLAAFVSRDGGINWVNVNAGIDEYQILNMVMDPVTPNVLYLGTDGNGVMKLVMGH